MIAEKWNLSREQMEAYALESHRRAIAARQKTARSCTRSRHQRWSAPTKGRARDTTWKKWRP